MINSTPVKNSEKGSANLWIEAAIEMFLESGIETVKIATLAKRLNLSRTSFYWFFEDRDALLEALLSTWKEKNTGGLLQQANAYADSLAEAALNIFDCWLNNELFDTRLEFAIRSWGLNSPKIRQEVQDADQLRLSALSRLFQRHGFQEIEADVHSRTLYLVQIGYITMQDKESLETRMRRIPEYVKTFTGVVPQPHELQRFYHRHNYFEGS